MSDGKIANDLGKSGERYGMGSMRLTEEERAVLKRALEEHAEAISGEDEKEEAATNHLLVRLRRWETLHFANWHGGMASKQKRQGKLEHMTAFMKGYAGSNWEQVKQDFLRPEPPRPNQKDRRG